MSQVRAAVLTNFDEIARLVGIDPAPLLRAAGLKPPALADPERMVPSAAVAHVLEQAARQSGCDQFGLLLAESRTLGSIGPVSLLLMHEPRVGDVIEALVQHQRLFGTAFEIRATTAGDALCVQIELSTTRQGTELAIAIFCRCIAAILDRRWAPESVHFVHSAPSDLRIHRRIFSCPIDFDSSFSGFVCTRDALHEQNPAGDEELAEHAERLLALIMPSPEMHLATDRVRRSLRLLLPERRATIEQVAHGLALSPRSLQRQLKREGQSFGALLDQVRRQLAQNYLSASHYVSQVAQMTGYHNTSSFTRWFKAGFGMSPSEWREQAATLDTPPPAPNEREEERLTKTVTR